jgi:hypothetical protein
MAFGSESGTAFYITFRELYGDVKDVRKDRREFRRDRGEFRRNYRRWR